MAYTAFYITMKITKQEKILLVTAIYGVLGLGFGISGKIFIYDLSSVHIHYTF